MKFRCERDVLVDALAIAGRAVSGRGGLPGLSGIRAELNGDDLELTGSDLDLTISVSIMVSGESDGAAVIPARLASEIVKAVQPGAVSFITESDELQITASRSEFSIRLIAGDEFPKTLSSEVEPVILPSAELTKALNEVVLAASSDDSRPILTGVLMAAEEEGVRLVATDGYRLARRDLPKASVLAEGQSVLIPSRALGELNRVLSNDDEVEMRLGEREAAFDVGSVRLVTRLIEGEFPNYRGLIPNSYPNEVALEREPFMDALRRVKLLARESTPVKLEMSNGELELVAITQDVGAARESIASGYDGADLTVAFNPQYLLEGLDVAPGEQVILSTIDELKPALIQVKGNDEFLYLLMPVRVS